MNSIYLPLSVISAVLSISSLIALAIVVARKNEEIEQLRLLVDFLREYMEKQADRFSKFYPCEDESKNCRFQDTIMGYPGVYRVFCMAKLALARGNHCPYVFQDSPEWFRKKSSCKSGKDSN